MINFSRYVSASPDVRCDVCLLVRKPIWLVSLRVVPLALQNSLLSWHFCSLRDSFTACEVSLVS